MYRTQLSTTLFNPKFDIVDMSEVADLSAGHERLFVETALSTSTYQVEAGRLALNRAQSLTVRDLARYMIGDHSYFVRKLQTSHCGYKAEIEGHHSADLLLLRETPGEKFDRVYLEQIRRAHEQAIIRLDPKPSLLCRIDAQLQSIRGELTDLIRRQIEMISGVQRRSQRLGIKPHYQADRA